MLELNFKTIGRQEFFQLIEKLRGKTYFFDTKELTVYETCIVKTENGLEKFGIMVQKLNENPTIYLLEDGLENDKEIKKILKNVDEQARQLLNNILYFNLSKENPNSQIFLTILNGDFAKFYSQVFRKIQGIIKKRIVVFEKNLKILVAFSIYTWLPEISDTATYLLITGDKGSGKTRTIETLSLICRRTLKTANTSIAFFARAIDKFSATLLIDEARIKSKEGSKEEEEDIWSILRAGNIRGMYYSRMVGATDEVKNYDVYGPKAIATNWGVPEDVEDRCLRIEMFREAGFIPKNVPKKTLFILQQMLSLLRIYFIANYDKIKKLLELNKKELSEKKYDGRFIEVVSNILVFSNLEPEEIREIQERKLESLNTSEASEVFSVLWELANLNNIDLNKISKPLYVELELAVKRWLANITQTSIEEIEKRIWATEKRRYSIRFSLILRNNLGLETKKTTERDSNGEIVNKRYIIIEPSKLLKLAKRFRDKYELKAPDQTFHVIHVFQVSSQKKYIDLSKIAFPSLVASFYEGPIYFSQQQVGIHGLQNPIRDKIINLLKGNGGYLDYFEVANIFRDNLQEALGELKQMIDDGLLSLIEDNGKIFYKMVVNNGATTVKV
jgi:hypothetical protein